MSRIVLKFGGSSVGDQSNYFDGEHMMKIASTVKEIKEQGNEVILVISAMAGTTRNLKSMCMNVDTRNNTLEDDMVLTVGEQITAGLITKMLNGDKFNLKAKAFLGWQVPIITDDNFGGAKIEKIETAKLEECFKNGIIPVIAGYQGITEDNRITTLGFDGSDTTAVAVACAVKADVCQFYKDVLGVYTANPRRVPKAQKLERISAKEMYVLASLGARILHPVSIKTAIDNNLTLKVVPNFDDNEGGTTIFNGDCCRDIVGVTYFEHSENMITISVVGNKITKEDGARIIKELNNNKIFAEVINTEFDDMSVTVEIGWIEQLNKAMQSIHTLYKFDNIDENATPAFRGDGKQIYRDPAIKTQ